MDPDAIDAALDAQLAAQAPETSVPAKSRAGKKKKKMVQPAGGVSPPTKKTKVVIEGEFPPDPTAKPFCFPPVGTPLSPDSIFNEANDHPYLLDRLAVPSDRELLERAGPASTFRLAQVASLQLALATSQLEKMFIGSEKRRSEAEERLKGVAAAESELTDLRAEVQRLKGELEGKEKDKEVALKEKEDAFALERQKMTNQAASYLIKGFERAKFQMSRVHPHANLSMLNVRTKDEHFVWVPPGSGDDEEDEDEKEDEGGEAAS